MANKMQCKSFLRSLLAICLLAANGMPTLAIEDGDTAKAGASGRIPVRLQKRQYTATTFGTEAKPGSPPVSGKLIAIDDTPVRGMSEHELNRLLLGSPGTHAKLTYLDNTDTVQTIDLERQEIKKFGTPALSDLNHALTDLDSQTEAIERGDHWEEQNLDLLARAYLRRSVDAAMRLPQDNSIAVSERAAPAVILSDMVGDMDGAGRYLKLVINQPIFDLQFGDFSPGQAEKLIADLQATNRLKEADQLCAKWLEAVKRGGAASPYQDARNLSGASKLYVEVLSAEGKNREARDVVASIFDTQTLASRQLNYNSETKDSLGRLFEQIGDLERASRVYEMSLKQCTLSLQPQGNRGLDLVRDYAFYAYRLAQVQEKQGQQDKAIEAIQDALKKYDSHTTQEDRLNAEKLCSFFPTESDLQSYLAELSLKKGDCQGAKDSAQSAASLIERAVGSKNAAMRRSLTALLGALKALNQTSEAANVEAKLNGLSATNKEREYTDAEKFTLLRSAANASQATDINKAVNQLLQIYKEQDQTYDHRRKSLNMFCALLNLARILSDRAHYAESNNLLDQLAKVFPSKEVTPVACHFIKIEKAINADRQKSRDDAWTEVVSAIPMKSSVPAESSSESPEVKKVSAAIRGASVFRSLAVLYAEAGDLERARILLDHALANQAFIEAAPQTAITADKYALERAKAILLLDAARIRALSGKLPEAQKLGDTAVQLCSSTLPDQGQQARNYNQQYRFKIVELAKAFKRRGVPNQANEQFLKTASSQLGKGATTDVDSDRGVSRYYGGYYALIDGYIARLMYEDGNAAGAEPFVKRALDQGGSIIPFDLWILAGDIAYKNRDYAAAAHRYSESENVSFSFTSPLYGAQAKKRYLKQAFECSSKARNLDQVERANICLREGAALEQDEPKSALKAFEEAYALIPDSDPGKARLNGRIARLKSTIAQAETKPISTGSTSVPASPGANQKQSAPNLTPEQIHAREVQNAKAALDSARTTAQMAVKNKDANAWSTWIQLASIEARAEQPKEAIEDAKRGMSLYKRTGDSWDFPDGLVPGAYGLAADLAKQGHAVEAEALLAEALKVMQSAFGKNSAAAAVQLSHIVTYYMSQQKYEDGYKALDELLQIDPRTIVVRSQRAQSALDHVVTYTVALNRENHSDVSLKILQKILDAQRKGLDQDDERIALSLRRIGELEIAMDKNDDAEKHLLEAARIYRLYVGYLRTSYATSGLLPKLWKKLGRADTEDIDVRPIGWVSLALLRKLGDEQDADLIQKTQKLPPDYIDPSYPSERRRVVFDPKADASKQIEQLQKEYSEACVEAPYSTRAMSALDNLVRIASSVRNWSVLADASIARAKIFERRTDEFAGRSLGCVPPATQRMDYYRNAATAFIHLGKTDEAQKWLDRAVNVLPEMTCLELITIANLELDCGNSALALKYADLADNEFTEQYMAVYPHIAGSVWKELGQPARADAIQAKREQMMERNRRQIEQAKNSPFSRTGI